MSIIYQKHLQSFQKRELLMITQKVANAQLLHLLIKRGGRIMEVTSSDVCGLDAHKKVLRPVS